MNDLRTAAQQALKCLNGVAQGNYDGNAEDVCAALRAALAEPEHKLGCALLKIPSRDCDCGAEPIEGESK